MGVRSLQWLVTQSTHTNFRRVSIVAALAAIAVPVSLLLARPHASGMASCWAHGLSAVRPETSLAELVDALVPSHGIPLITRPRGMRLSLRSSRRCSTHAYDPIRRCGRHEAHLGGCRRCYKVVSRTLPPPVNCGSFRGMSSVTHAWFAGPPGRARAHTCSWPAMASV
jgi:hypothetical protein